MEYLVYAAGPIRGLSYDAATQWRTMVAERLAPFGIRVFSPMRAKGFLAGAKQLGSAPHEHPITSPKGDVTRDFFDLRRADLVLVNLAGAAKISIGTLLEIGAAHVLNKPIVLAMEPGNVHEHRIIREIAGFVVPTLDEAIDITKAVLLPDQ
jgi:nucleoside 2-deoxyribosyltransferase